MERLRLSCETCEQTWMLGESLSYYEQESLESQPCPNCEAHTLKAELAAEPTRPRFSSLRRRRSRAIAHSR